MYRMSGKMGEGDNAMTKQQFLGQLEKEKIVDDLAVQLRGETVPLILWGLGDVAYAVSQYLRECGIGITDIWVDGEMEKKEFYGIRIKKREEILKQYSEFNVLLGHSRYELGEKLKKEMPGVKNVYYAFSVHYGQHEKVAYERIEREAERFVQLCNILEDKSSVDNLLAYLNTKMTGDVFYILNAYRGQMNFCRNDVFSMTEEEVFLDIGAYNGDTMKLFLEETNGRYKRILAVEPDEQNFLELNEYVAKMRLKNVVTRKNGAWNCCEELQFQAGKEQVSIVDTGDRLSAASGAVTIHGERLDKLFDQEEITFIKINYCKGIVEAIEGCYGILVNRHPKIALDVGYDIYKVLELSEYLASLKQDYHMFLRFNRAMSSTFTLYAV